MKIGGNVQKGRAGRISGQIMGKDIRRKKGSGRRGRS